jgi:hypothetical protein
MNGVLEALNRRARSALGKLDAPTFSKNSPNDMKNLTVVLQMVTAMAEVMRTPILTDGEVSEQSGQIVVKYREVVEN